MHFAGKGTCVVIKAGAKYGDDIMIEPLTGGAPSWVSTSALLDAGGQALGATPTAVAPAAVAPASTPTPTDAAAPAVAHTRAPAALAGALRAAQHARAEMKEGNEQVAIDLLKQGLKLKPPLGESLTAAGTAAFGSATSSPRSSFAVSSSPRAASRALSREPSRDESNYSEQPQPAAGLEVNERCVCMSSEKLDASS